MVSLEEVIKAYRTLQKLEPKNKLLNYARVENDFTIAWPARAYKEFIDRYVRKNPWDKVEDVNDVYLEELKNAIGEAESRNKRPAPKFIIPKQTPRQQKLFGNP